MSTRSDLIKLTKESLRKNFSLPIIGESPQTKITDLAVDLIFPHLTNDMLDDLGPESTGLAAEIYTAVETAVTNYNSQNLEVPATPGSEQKTLFDDAVTAILAWIETGDAI